MLPALPAAYNFTTPYSIWYNDAGNYPPSVYNPGDAAQYGFIVDDDTHWPRHNGTISASFGVEDGPEWPNFLFGLTNNSYDPWAGVGNVSWTSKKNCEDLPGGSAARRDSPIGPVCCSRVGGCVPQEADMAALTAMVSESVQKLVPPDMTGNCVLDMESWAPVVDLDGQFGNTFAHCPILGDEDSGTAGKKRPRPIPKPMIVGATLWYNYSCALVRQRSPHLSEAEVVATAAREFLSAATAVWVQVIRVAKSVRPRCHWGFFGDWAVCEYHNLCTNQTATSGDPLCGFMNPKYREKIWNITQQQLPIIAEADALYPDLYIGSPRMHGYDGVSIGYRRGEMRSIVGQAVAGGDAVGGRPVLPFARTACMFGTLGCYGKALNDSVFLSPEAVYAGLAVPYEVGAAGVVLYQEQEAVHDSAELAKQLATVTGPYGRELLTAIRGCARERCSGHGRCMPLPSNFTDKDVVVHCQCDAHWSGSVCERKGPSLS